MIQAPVAGISGNRLFFANVYEYETENLSILSLFWPWCNGLHPFGLSDAESLDVCSPIEMNRCPSFDVNQN